jgi:hypothetical protein
MNARVMYIGRTKEFLDKLRRKGNISSSRKNAKVVCITQYCVGWEGLTSLSLAGVCSTDYGLILLQTALNKSTQDKRQFIIKLIF